MHSTYLGHADAADTQVSHLVLRAGAAETNSHSVAHDELPVAHARQRRLYGHLQHLQDLLEAKGLGAARVEGLDDAALFVEA